MDFIPPTWNELEEAPVAAPVEPKPVGPHGNGSRGAGRGRQGRGGRGQPGEGRNAGRVVKKPELDEHDEVGKVPKKYRNCRADNGKNICVNFQTGKCNQGYGGSCGKPPRERLHICATIVNLEEMTLCQSDKHAHDSCPNKAD